ncbi:asparagine synthase [Microvenator marinus]|uniref:asparagine synthase (glutamine-hydrolyzing) n=1 Tax=Microvenator marinus TaxID=2600177 RepID=A0A5B8XT27_9DELT|nr:asparagine synthase [Microvenator marinus]
MRDGVLVKVDRTTMRYGLEARSPFLDHRLVQFAQSLPSHFKKSGQTFKLILRLVLADKIPSVSNLPKTGFGVPIPGVKTERKNEFRLWQESALVDWNLRFPP